MATAARGSKKGEEPLKTIDMSYTEKDDVYPNASKCLNNITRRLDVDVVVMIQVRNAFTAILYLTI